MWQRLSKLQIWLVAGFITCLLIVFYLSFGRVWPAQASDSLIPAYSEPAEDSHPVIRLVARARHDFRRRSGQQSRSLPEAIRHYKERYSINPPPHFDKWYEFVEANDIPLRDEYDDIFECLKPFWGLPPALIRKNVATAIATNDYITGVSIRRGEIIMTERGEEWRRKGIKSAIEPFAYLLPDLDIAFNRHDEPRTIIPYDQLAQLLKKADENHATYSMRRDTWSSRPSDLDSMLEGQVNRSPFIECNHPFTWPISTLSCPPDSPARALNVDDTYGPDATGAYTLDPFYFVRNRTAITDICNQPLLRGAHSFFNSPNTWSITHDPIPIFSPSKVSTFQDILFPAPWYLAEMTQHDSSLDMPWSEKQDSLYWRGATTSGFSDHGVWHYQNRQRFVQSVEKPGEGFTMKKGASGDWNVQEVRREAYENWFDVHFYLIDNCAESDCEAQQNYFDVKPRDPYDINWKHKFLLDIDGNAFSGRFYTFLESNSLTLKQALFREWHEARVVPWVHYIPLGFNQSDHLEILRFFNDEVDGQKLALEIAQESSKWAQQTLRHTDMQAWAFRLLLEYARLVDDSRNEVGISF